MEKIKEMYGLFDGQSFVSEEGRLFPVPQNYASKSRLIEGDILKMKIEDNGGLIFKQVKQVERKNLIGIVEKSGASFKIKTDIKFYKVLSAFVSYYKLEEGDKVSITTAREDESDWCAIECLLNKEKDLEIKKIDESIIERIELAKKEKKEEEERIKKEIERDKKEEEFLEEVPSAVDRLNKELKEERCDQL